MNSSKFQWRIDLDRMGLYFKFIGCQKANTTSTSRLMRLVLHGIVKGQISEIQDVATWGIRQVSVRARISNFFNITTSVILADFLWIFYKIGGLEFLCTSPYSSKQIGRKILRYCRVCFSASYVCYAYRAFHFKTYNNHVII